MPCHLICISHPFQTPLGVLSLSIANTQLIFGVFTLLCAAALVGSFSRAANVILKGEDAAEVLEAKP